MALSSRPISWIRAARRDFEEFPSAVQLELLRALAIAAEGRMPDIAKPLRGFGSGVLELALRHRGDAFRVVYALQIDSDLWVAHAFQKKSKSGIRTPKIRDRFDRPTVEPPEGIVAMTDEPIEIERGSGNVFRDFDHPDADREQLRAMLAAKVIGLLDDRRLSPQDAEALTGIPAADFQRIRRATLGRVTIDRLMAILSRLGQRIEISVNISPRRGSEAQPEPTPL
jgi:phage-related protein/predicted XRE-type DNA-binding protein